MERAMVSQGATTTHFMGVQIDIERVKKLISDLAEVLRAQNSLLKTHGWSLPPSTLGTLSDVSQRLARIGEEVDDLAREHGQYYALIETSALINSSLDLTQVLNSVMDTVIRLIGAERGYIVLRNQETGEMEFRIARNMDHETISAESFEISRTIVSQVATTGQPIVTTNAQVDPRFMAQESIVAYNLRSILCVPLKVRDVVTGVVYADNKLREAIFGEHDLSLLVACANQAAIAIENARLFERLKANLAAISEMKNLQDNIFASIVSGVITTDTENRIALINRRAEDILGLQDQDPLGWPLDQALPPLDRRFDRLIEQVRGQDAQLTGIEFETEIEKRGPVSLSMNLSPLKDAEQHTQGVAIVVDDMTELKRREAQIAGVRRYIPSEVVDGLTSVEALKLGGTRQVISIIFGDIREFTPFSERQAPERLLDIINTYFTIAADAIHSQQGVIDKFMGDAVMALFNAPIRPQADHALRTVRAAAAMRSDIEAYHLTIPASERLMFGIGVHTGEAVVGNIGSPDRLNYSAVGDSVNLARRLQEMAGPGQIILSEDTYRLVSDRVEVNPLGPIQVEGRTQLTNIYELLRVRV
jgi:adenylate cyclase